METSMTRSILSPLALAAVLFAAVAGPVRAADLVLDCKVEANHADHGLTRWRRRIILDPPTRTTRIMDDFGHGFVQRDTYAFVSMNPRRIVLEEHGAKVSTIDRMSGEYVLKNPEHRFMLRGHCERGGAPAIP
jgi:hypothetical protein